MNNSQIKQLSKQQIKGTIGTCFLAMLVSGLITSVASIVSWLIAPAFALSFSIIYLNITKGIKPQVGDVFAGFNNLWGAFKLTFFQVLYTMLWSCLFYIPGIVKTFSYAMAPFILAENPGIGANEAITRSRKMMDGHKMRLFGLMLSFIGWIILGYFTLGILYIWLFPYMQTSLANFYNSIKTPVQQPAYTYEAPQYNAGV